MPSWLHKPDWRRRNLVRSPRGRDSAGRFDCDKSPTSDAVPSLLLVLHRCLLLILMLPLFIPFFSQYHNQITRYLPSPPSLHPCPLPPLAPPLCTIFLHPSGRPGEGAIWCLQIPTPQSRRLTRVRGILAGPWRSLPYAPYYSLIAPFGVLGSSHHTLYLHQVPASKVYRQDVRAYLGSH